jgi:hypothetical protein
MFKMLADLWNLLSSFISHTQGYVDAYGEVGMAAKDAATRFREEVKSEQSDRPQITN